MLGKVLKKMQKDAKPARKASASVAGGKKGDEPPIENPGYPQTRNNSRGFHAKGSSLRGAERQRSMGNHHHKSSVS